MDAHAPVLAVSDLTVRFDTPEGQVDAVSGLNFSVNSGETVAVVGESGSGKSQTFLAVMGLLARNGHATGRAMLDDTDLLSLTPSELDRFRGSKIGMMFQDPMTALNPALRISRQLTETLEVHEGLSRAKADQRALAMLDTLGIPEAENRFHMYVHELSGGMRQRIMIAMALLSRPKLLIADEPTTALDATIQAQILDLFAAMRHDLSTAMVLITHDLGVVAALADRVVVMYAGRVVEEASVDDLFRKPRHPYTAALLASTPRIDGAADSLRPITGQPPNLQNLPNGCAFEPRCRFAIDRCGRERPRLESLQNGQKAACFRADEMPLKDAS